MYLLFSNSTYYVSILIHHAHIKLNIFFQMHDNASPKPGLNEIYERLVAVVWKWCCWSGFPLCCWSAAPFAMAISRMSMNVTKVLHQAKVNRLSRILEITWCGTPLWRMVMGGKMQTGRRKSSKVAGMGEEAAKPVNASVTPSRPNGRTTNTMSFYPPTMSWQWPILIKLCSSGTGTRSRSGVPSFAKHVPKILAKCKMPWQVKKVLWNLVGLCQGSPGWAWSILVWVFENHRLKLLVDNPSNLPKGEKVGHTPTMTGLL